MRTWFVALLICAWILPLMAVTATDQEIQKAEAWFSGRFQSDSATAAPFSFILDGKSSATFIKDWRVETISRTLDDQQTEHVITYSDPETGLVVRCVGTVFSDFPAVEWVMYLKNTGTKDTPILENILPLNDTMAALEKTPLLHYSKGALCCLDDYEPVEQKLDPESRINLQPGGGRSSSEVLPFFNIDLGSQGIVVGIGWTGEWAATFSRDNENNVQMQAGMELTHLKLHTEEEIRTPRVLLLFWQANDTDAADRQRFRGNNLLRRFILAHHRPQPDGKPLTLPIVFGSWGGWSAAEHIKNINRIIDHKLPVGLYWIDAEWFGKGDWWFQAGDWRVKKDLYPDGFKPISDLLHRNGKQLLVWFELFRICKGTPWYQLKDRDNWLLELKNGEECFQEWRTNAKWPVPHDDPRWIHWESRRSQMTEDERLFNLANPEARKFLTDLMSQKIEEFGLDWYREDANIAPLEYWREADETDRQGMTEIRYVEGLYTFWDDLLDRYPHLKIDNCASGGRRIDLETIGRSTVLHRTDWARSAIHAQCHSYGLFQWLPLHMAGRGAVPEKGNEYELRSVMTTGLMTGLWDQKKGDLSQDALKMLDQYLDIQKYYYGDYYPLTPYSQKNSDWIAWQFDLPEEGEGMIQAFRRGQSVYESSRLNLSGLKPDVVYIITNVDSGQQTEKSGHELLNNGLLIAITEEPGSALITYKKKM